MGMYTEFHYNASLRSDVPDEVIAALQSMLKDPTEQAPPFPEHELFKTRRFRVMLMMDSYYFDTDTHSTLRFDDIGDCYYLCIRCNLKNYDSEIEKFIDWIRPYIDKMEGDFLGFIRYEEQEEPELIFAS